MGRPRTRLALGLAASCLLLCLAVLVGLRLQARHAQVEEPPPVPSQGLVLPPPTLPTRVERVTIQAGDTLGGLLTPFGLDANALREAALAVYDLSAVRAGRELVLVFRDGASSPQELRYAIDDDRTLVLVLDEGAWQAHMDQAVFHDTLVRRELVVQTSLWEAALQAGLRPADIVAVAHIFESEVDFNTEVRPGARLVLVALEQVRVEDGFTRLRAPLAARFDNDGKTWQATRFQPDPDHAPEYFDDEGRNRRGAFLRSPLEFSSVTSGFSTGRFHPVLKEKRPHWGTDFGAPVDTPVRAVARGTVVKAGPNGGHGNYVEIQHDGPYRTSYSHLSKVLVHKGEAVSQGEVVGKVGQTGLATGPHLHYQLWIKGQHADPMKAQLPHDQRMETTDLPAFLAWRDRVRAVLDGADPAGLDLSDAPPG